MAKPITDEPIYRIWKQMHQRCYNPNNAAYTNYGGRGIRVDDRWQSFVSFVIDMGQAPTRTSIDRIDNDGPYSKENCRWATALEQSDNRRWPYHGENQGIRVMPSGRFQARVGQKVVGTFSTLEEAINSRKELIK